MLKHIWNFYSTSSSTQRTWWKTGKKERKNSVRWSIVFGTGHLCCTLASADETTGDLGKTGPVKKILSWGGGREKGLLFSIMLQCWRHYTCICQIHRKMQLRGGPEYREGLSERAGHLFPNIIKSRSGSQLQQILRRHQGNWKTRSPEEA